MGTSYPPDLAGTIAKIGAAVTEIQAQLSRTDRLAADAIDGMVITGATIRTSAGPDRVELAGDTLSVFSGNILQVRLRPSTGLELRDPNSGAMIPLSDQAFGSASVSYPGTLSKTLVAGSAASAWQLIASTPPFTTRTGRINMQASAAKFGAAGYKATVYLETYLSDPDADTQVSGTVQSIAVTDQYGLIGGFYVPVAPMKNVTVPPGPYRVRTRWRLAPGAGGGPSGNTDHVGSISDINVLATPL